MYRFESLGNIAYRKKVISPVAEDGVYQLVCAVDHADRLIGQRNKADQLRRACPGKIVRNVEQRAFWTRY